MIRRKTAKFPMPDGTIVKRRIYPEFTHVLVIHGFNKKKELGWHPVMVCRSKAGAEEQKKKYDREWRTYEIVEIQW